MYLDMYVHTYVCMYVCVYIHTYTDTHMYMYMCLCVRMYIFKIRDVFKQYRIYLHQTHTHVFVRVSVCMNVCDICMYVFKTLIPGNPKQHACMSIFACSFVHIFTHNMCSQHQSSMHKHEPVLSALMMAAFPCSSKFSEVASATGITWVFKGNREMNSFSFWEIML